MPRIQEATHSEFYFQWHITKRCNLRCRHCYQEGYSSAQELDLAGLMALARKMVDALSRWNLKGRIAITGGEPLLRHDLWGLLDNLGRFEEVRCLDILSNGSLIDGPVARRLSGVGKLRRVQLSLDGGTADVHDAIRGVGAFDKTMSAIGHLRQHGMPVRIMFTLHAGNVDELPELLRLCELSRVEGLTVDRLVCSGAGRQMRDQVLPPARLREAYEYLSACAEESRTRPGAVRILRLRTLWANLSEPDQRSWPSDEPGQREAVGAACSAGMDSLCVLEDGTVLPCRRLPIAIGNLVTDSLFGIWFGSDVLWKLRDKTNLKGKCRGCRLIPVCGGCRAMAYAWTGDYLEEDPQCWIEPAPGSCEMA